MVIEYTLAEALDFIHMDALIAFVPLKKDIDLQFALIASTLDR